MCFRLVLKLCPSKNGILFGECQPKPSKRNGTLNRRFEPPREAGYADAILCMEVQRVGARRQQGSDTRDGWLPLPRTCIAPPLLSSLVVRRTPPNCQRVASAVTSSHQAGELGFEPRQADPESAVLPLHHSPGDREGILTAGFVLDKAREGMPWMPITRIACRNTRRIPAVPTGTNRLPRATRTTPAFASSEPHPSPRTAELIVHAAQPDEAGRQKR